MVFTGGTTLTVESYIPEWWELSGDLLVYLDVNRELRGLRNGKPVKMGNDAFVIDPILYGDAVIYTAPTGHTTVIERSKVYVF